MNSVNEILITIEPVVDHSYRSKDKKELDRYLQLIDKLTPSGAKQLKIALVNTAKASAEQYDDVFLRIPALNRIFGENKIISMDDYEELQKVTSRVCIVERIRGAGKDFSAVSSIETESNVVKYLLKHNLRNISNAEDRELIFKHYDIDDSDNRKIAEIDTEFLNYATKYYHYLYEFYRRNNVCDASLLNRYCELSKSSDEVRRLYGFFSGYAEEFEYTIKLDKSLEQTLADIDEYCSSLKYYAKELYSKNKVVILDYIRDCNGNKSYKKQFELWERYLKVYDLYIEKMVIPDMADNRKIDAIGKQISNDFNVFATLEAKDRRKEIKKDYAKALELIINAGQGSLHIQQPS